MYQTGELIIYGGSGVCRVVSVGTPALSYLDPARVYYTLAPMYSTETIYVPVDTGISMRRVLTREEAEGLVRRIPSIPEEAVEISNPTLLAQYYQTFFQAGDPASLIRLLKTIYTKNVNAGKKKAGRIDDKYRKLAEELLYNELSVALALPRDRIASYLRQTLDNGLSGCFPAQACRAESA